MVIQVHILPSLDANLTLDAKNGNVKVHEINLDFSIKEDKLVIGTTNSGIHKVNVVSMNGDIDLYKIS